MNFQAILAQLQKNPTAALKIVSGLLPLLTPELFAALLPAVSPVPLVAYAKQHPADALDFIKQIIAAIDQHPSLMAALLTAIPKQ